MSKICKRLVLFTFACIMMMTVQTFASTRLYERRTVYLDEDALETWSYRFTLFKTSEVKVGITLRRADGTEINPSYLNMGYELYDSATGKAAANLKVPDDKVGLASYTLSTTLPKGTYSLMISDDNADNYPVKVTYSIESVRGITLPDDVKVEEGDSVTIQCTYADGRADLPNIDYVTWDNHTDYMVTWNTADSKIHINGYRADRQTVVTVHTDDGDTASTLVSTTKDVPQPYLTTKSVTLDAGQTLRNGVAYASGRVTWSSSRTSVAKVDKKGTIKAVGYGSCKIYAKISGISQALVCKVHVNRTLPQYTAYIKSYSRKNRTVKIRIYNESAVPITIVSGSGMKLKNELNDKTKTLRLVSGSVSINSKKSRTLTFRYTGKKYTLDITKLMVQFRFREDKLNYYAQAWRDKTESRYRAKGKQVWSPSHIYTEAAPAA